jgi:hypothetical protein
LHWPLPLLANFESKDLLLELSAEVAANLVIVAINIVAVIEKTLTVTGGILPQTPAHTQAI